MTSPAIRVPSLRRGRCPGRGRAGKCCTITLGVVSVALALGHTSLARAEEPTIDEVRYHPTELPPDGTRARMLVTGAALTAGWYGVGVGTSFLWPNAKNARDLRLPVVGPWMALGDVGCGSKERDCRDTIVVLRTTLAVLSGIGQAGGLLAMVEGLFLNTGTLSAEAPVGPRTERPQALSSRPSWAAVPVVLPDGAAIEVVGHF
jgi:hypothetical protein